MYRILSHLYGRKTSKGDPTQRRSQDWSEGGGGPNLANVSVVGRVSVKFPCYMLLTVSSRSIFLLACQYMKIPTDLDPNPPPPLRRILAQNPPPPKEFLDPPLDRAANQKKPLNYTPLRLTRLTTIYPPDSKACRYERYHIGLLTCTLRPNM